MKAVAAAADVVRPPPRGVVILLYHRVGTSTGREFELSAARFDEQVARVADRVIGLDDALTALRHPAPTGADPVVITFDDGTADLAEHALPVLERHEVPATIYVATDHIERQMPFPHHGKPLTWSALAEATSTGLVTVGSHTHTHAVVDQLDRVQIEEELDRSVGLIEDRLGVAVRHFAYPKGVAGPAHVDEAVRSRFDSAALAAISTNRYGATDVHRLARSPVQSSDGTRWFDAKARGGMAVEGWLREALNRRRYASLSN
jgi:peptidoglycan/xylan/chitin deacetylase (PgdA/CDA1 family)